MIIYSRFTIITPMRIILIAPNIRPVEIERGYNVKPRQTAPAYGLLSIAGVLREHGHQVAYYDPSLEDTMEAAEEELQTLAPEFDVFGVSTTGFTMQYDARAMEVIRKSNPDAIVVAGGYFATFRHDETLHYTEADIVTMGEAEHAFLKIVKNLDTKGWTHPLNIYAAQQLAGPGMLTEHSKCIYGSRTSLTLSSLELNNLPTPAWDLVDMDSYEKHWGCRFIPYSTSRGCNQQCTFCVITEFCNRNVRSVTPEKVIKDITSAVSTIQPDHVAFSDPNFTANPKRAAQIAETIKAARESGMIPDNIKFGCQSRVDTVTPELLSTLKEAGFTEMWYGFESGSQHILNEYHKQISVSDNYNTIKETLKRGIIPVGFMIMASNESTVTDIFKTLEFITSLTEYGGTISPDSSYWVTPFMGTEQIQANKDKSSGSIGYMEIALVRDGVISYLKEGFAVYPDDEHAKYIISSAYQNLQLIGTATPQTRIEALFRGFFDYFNEYTDRELKEKVELLNRRYCHTISL